MRGDIQLFGENLPVARRLIQHEHVIGILEDMQSRFRAFNAAIPCDSVEGRAEDEAFSGSASALASGASEAYSASLLL